MDGGVLFFLMINEESSWILHADLLHTAFHIKYLCVFQQTTTSSSMLKAIFFSPRRLVQTKVFKYSAVYFEIRIKMTVTKTKNSFSIVRIYNEIRKIKK